MFTEADFVGGLLPPPEAEFGTALAAGDFDGDDAVDLAVGAPGRTAANASAAGVVFLMDSVPGDPLAGRAVMAQSNLFAGESETGDHFGSALAAGDFDADDFADLAIGVPYEDVVGGDGQQIRNAGEVDVRYGSTDGLAAGSDQRFRQGTGGVEGTTEAGDLFGTSLTAWNFGRNVRPLGSRETFRMADLAIGVPFEDLFNPDGTVLPDAGAVNVLYGIRDSGLSVNGDQLFFQSNIGAFTNVTDDRFGHSLY